MLKYQNKILCFGDESDFKLGESETGIHKALHNIECEQLPSLKVLPLAMSQGDMTETPIKVLKQRGNYTIILTQNSEVYICGDLFSKSPKFAIFEGFVKCPYRLHEIKIIDMKCSSTDIVILTEDHKLYSLSENQFESKENQQVFVYNPRPNEETEKIKHFDVGKGYHIYTTEDGKCYAKGDNFTSLLNEENKNESYMEIPFDEDVTPIQPICSIFEETSTVVLMMVESNYLTEIWTCGKSSHTLLGQGDSITESLMFRPMKITNDDMDIDNVSFKKVQFNDTFGFALTDDGDLYGWGKDAYNQFGYDAPNMNLNCLTKIPMFSKFMINDIAVGQTHALISVSFSLIREYLLILVFT